MYVRRRALLAAEKGSARFVHLHRLLLQRDVIPLVPVVVLAQAWRGGPQPNLSRMLKGCQIMPDDERLGRAAGTACAAAGSHDVVDALVVVTALAHDASIVTSDRGDLEHLADALGLRLHLVEL